MADEPLADDVNRRKSDEDEVFVPNPDKLKPRRTGGISFASAPPPPPPSPVNTVTQPAATPAPVTPPPAFTPPPPPPAASNSTGEGSAATASVQADAGFSEFINKRWRPMMAFIYMVTCTTDFVLFPVLWSILQTVQGGQVHSQWAPLTLQGAGLYHIAMGAVLGLAAYGRSQEKIAGRA